MAGHRANGEMRFEVDGPPIAEPRQRVEIRWKKAAATGRMTAYPHHYLPDDHPVHAFKQAVRLMAAQAKPKNWDASLPMEVEILAIFPRRDGDTNIGRLWDCSQRDVDNLGKSILDSLTGLIYDDDRQVVEFRLIKIRARQGEKARTVIRVRQKFDEVPDLSVEI